MSGTEHLRDVLGNASANLGDAIAAGNYDRLKTSSGYARGVLDALAAVMADEDADAERALALSTERRRGPDGRFMPSEHAQALRDGTANPS